MLLGNFMGHKYCIPSAYRFSFLLSRDVGHALGRGFCFSFIQKENSFSNHDAFKT